jgi:hypothetical protein
MNRYLQRAGNLLFAATVAAGAFGIESHAQIAPSARQLDGYTGLLAAAARGDVALIRKLVQSEPPDVRDAYDRTPLHVAAYAGHHEAMRALVAAGADPNALERDSYDIVTIAAVANDLPTLTLALSLGTRAGNITSRYEGTALIAAAHLGHVEVVETLLRAGAPLDHVNNLGWTDPPCAGQVSRLPGDGTRAEKSPRALRRAGRQQTRSQGKVSTDLSRRLRQCALQCRFFAAHGVGVFLQCMTGRST